MNRNFHNPQGSSAQVRQRISRWFSVLIVLALAVASTSLTPPALAARAGDTEIKFTFITIPTNPICVGEKKEIDAYLHRRLQPSDPEYTTGLGGTRQAVPGVPIKATVADPSIGQISPTQSTTDVFGTADFVFSAEHPGETAITFEGKVVTPGWFGTNWGGDSFSGIIQHSIKVINCKFETTTIGEWHVPGPANLHIVAISDDAEVKADEQGNLTGSTTVNWAETATGVGNCPPPVRIERGSSRVDWHGEMDDSGQLTLEGAYLPSQGSITVFCGTGGTFPVQLTPDPLQVSVAFSGGSIRQSQVLQGPEAITGYVTIIVVPDEYEAVSFIPGNHQPSWDDFFSLFGALALP